MERKSFIDISKGLGILSVILFHISIKPEVLKVTASFQLPLFFLVSGFLFRDAYEPKTYITKKAKGLLIPYYAYGFLTLIYYFIVEKRFRSQAAQISLPTAIKGLLFGISEGLEFNVALWFLLCLFIISVLFYLIKHYIKRDPIIIGISIILSTIYFYFLIPPLPFQLHSVMCYLPYYALGYYVSKLSASQKWNVPFFCGTLAIYATVFYLSIDIFRTSTLNSYLVGLSGSLLIVAVSHLFEKFAILRKALAYIGSNSLTVLCIHGPVYRVVLKLLSICSGTTVDFIRTDLTWSFVAVFVTLGVCLVGCRVIEWFLKLFTK